MWCHAQSIQVFKVNDRILKTSTGTLMWALWGFDWQDHLLTDVVKDSYIWRRRESRSLRHEGFPCSLWTWDDHEFWGMLLTRVFNIEKKHLCSISSCAHLITTRVNALQINRMFSAILIPINCPETIFLKSSALKTLVALVLVQNAVKWKTCMSDIIK